MGIAKHSNGSEKNSLTTSRSGFLNGFSLELFIHQPDNILSFSTSSGKKKLFEKLTRVIKF